MIRLVFFIGPHFFGMFLPIPLLAALIILYPLETLGVFSAGPAYTLLPCILTTITSAILLPTPALFADRKTLAALQAQYFQSTNQQMPLLLNGLDETRRNELPWLPTLGW